MTQEYLLLNILLYKSCFRSYKDDVDLKALKETYRELSYVFDTVYTIHEKVEGDVTIDEVAAMFWAKYPSSDKVVYGKIFETLKGSVLSESSAGAVVAEYQQRALALRVSELAFKLAQDGGDLTAINELLAPHTAANTTGDLGVNLVTDDLVSLLGDKFMEGGRSWPLNALNVSLGPLRDGDFGFIFARPESGKTTLLSHCMAHWLSLPGDDYLAWFNNEEQDYKVKLRVYQSYFGLSAQVILASLKKYQDRFNAETKGRFLLLDGSRIHYRSVEKVMARYNPKVMIYDQLTKITGFKADRNDLELGEKFQWARELAKNNHAAIGVSQADGTAENVRYLTMEHVANAKTAVQAEADFILGIGKQNTTDDHTRYLALSKNKLLGDKDTLEELRHGRFDVMMEPTIGRYKDIIKYS